MKKLIILICIFSCLLSCANDANVENVKEEYNPEGEKELIFNSVKEIQKYIQYNSQLLDYNWDYTTSRFYFRLNDEIEVDMTPYNAEIINGNIKMPYILKYDNKSYSSYLLYTIEDDESGVLLSFDDYFYPNWDDILKYFIDNNKKATWFCFGAPSRPGLKNFYFAAKAAGQEVGYHSLEHKIMRDADIDVVKKGLIDPLGDFANYGIYFNCMSYCGGGEPCVEAQELLKTKYKLIRSCADGVNRGNSLIFYSVDELKSGNTIYGHSFDQHYYKTDSEFQRMMLSRLCMAKMLKKIYPGFSHKIIEEGTVETTSTAYTVKLENLLYLFKLIDDLKLKSYLYKDFY